MGIGSSIAVQGGDSGAGTLGGYVRLEKVGMTPKHCALTCHHVVVSKKSSPPSKWPLLPPLVSSFYNPDFAQGFTLMASLP